MYRDEYDALHEQLLAARKDAESQRRRHGEELESERLKVLELERQLAQLKKARQGKPEVVKARRKLTLLMVLIGVMVAAGFAAAMLFAAAPSPVPRPPRPVPARVKVPIPPRASLPSPTPKETGDPGTTAHLLSLVKIARAPSRMVLAHLAAAAVHKRAGADKEARASMVTAMAQLPEKMFITSLLRGTALVECLREKITGEAPGPAGRYSRLEPLLDKQLSYKIATDAWTWVGRVCRDLGGGAAALEALPRGLKGAVKGRSFQRLNTIMAAATVYEEQRDLAGVDRAAAVILAPETGLIVTDTTKGKAMLAEIYWRLGNKDKAATLLKEAALQRPGKYFSAEAHAMVARAMAVLGWRAEAEARLAVATEAVRSNDAWNRKKSIPHLAATHLLLGRADKAHGLLDGAVLAAESMIQAGLLKEATRVKTISRETRYQLALALARIGERDLALAEAQKLGYSDLRPLALAGVMLNSKVEAEAPAPR